MVINGERKAVNGDLTKLRRVPTLSAAARKMLTNMEAPARNVAGAHEVRSAMRHQTHAYRANFGLAIARRGPDKMIQPSQTTVSA